MINSATTAGKNSDSPNTNGSSLIQGACNIA